MCLLNERSLAILLTLSGVALLAMPVDAGEARVDLVIGGEDAAELIVVPDNQWMSPEAYAAIDRKHLVSNQLNQAPLVYSAALLIQEYAGRITGADLSIIAETQWEQQGRPPAVHVGRTRLARQQFGPRIDSLKNQGWIAESVPDRLLMCGSTDWATYNAAAGVLEKACGVEWFWPGELGEQVPRKDRLTFDRFKVIEEPTIAFSGGGWAGEVGTWAARVGERQQLERVRHDLGEEIYHAGRLSNEEWFPLVDGERLIPEATKFAMHRYWNPCMASPEAIRRAVTAAEQHLLATGGDFYSLGVNDGVWRGCECSYCTDMDEIGPDPAFDTDPYHVNGRYSARYFHFVASVADAMQEQFPGSRAAGFVYAGTDLPPARFKPNEHLSLTVISTKLAWYNHAFREWEELRHRKWSRLAGDLVSYDYMYQVGYIPMYSPHLHAEVTRFLAANGYTRSYAETYATLARSGPRYWVHMKLCVDPSQDVDALLDRWMRGMFGQAAEPMHDYYRAIEEAWETYPFHEWHTDAFSTYCFVRGADIPVLTPETISRMDRALDKAQKQCGDDETVKARLQVVADNHLATRAYAIKLWRARPYRVPVPFDDRDVLTDLTDHVNDEPIFDEVAFYEKHLADQAVSHMAKLARRGIDTPSQRLGRAVDGLVEPVLRRKMADEGAAMSEVEAAIDTRVEAMASAASASGKVRATLHDLADRVVQVKKVESVPKVDGRLDDAIWSSLTTYRGFVPDTENELVSQEDARHVSSFSIAHDGTHVYLAIRCRQDPATIDAGAEDGKGGKGIARDDRVVVRLAPWQYAFRGIGGDLTLTVTAGGVVTESSRGYGSTYWHAGTRAEARIVDDGYVVEMAIPMRAFLYSPERGPYLRFNIQRRVAGEDAEASSWYPSNLGDTFACVEPFEADGLLATFNRLTARPMHAGTQSESMTSEAWEHYVIQAPADVNWGQEARPTVNLTGGRSVLLGSGYRPVQTGHRYELAVHYTGSGTVLPRLNFFRSTEIGMADVLRRQLGEPLVDFEQANVTEVDGVKSARVEVVVPDPADHVRFRIEAAGDVQVHGFELIPRLPLEVTVDVNTYGLPELRTGHVVGIQATIRNVSDQPIRNVDVSMGYPSGVDLRAHAVTAARTFLEPGEATHALWWATPVYAVGEAKFTVITTADGLPRLVSQVQGPVSGDRE